MLARTPVAVAAGADFVVEGAVDFVLLCAEDGGEVLGHDEGGFGIGSGEEIRSGEARSVRSGEDIAAGCRILSSIGCETDVVFSFEL